jgi:hypothetical protein
MTSIEERVIRALGVWSGFAYKSETMVQAFGAIRGISSNQARLAICGQHEDELISQSAMLFSTIWNLGSKISVDGMFLVQEKIIADWVGIGVDELRLIAEDLELKGFAREDKDKVSPTAEA